MPACKQTDSGDGHQGMKHHIDRFGIAWFLVGMQCCMTSLLLIGGRCLFELSDLGLEHSRTRDQCCVHSWRGGEILKLVHDGRLQEHS